MLYEVITLFREGNIFLQGAPEHVLTFDTIETVYKTPVITRINPYSNKPVIFLVSEKMMKNR